MGPSFKVIATLFHTCWSMNSARDQKKTRQNLHACHYANAHKYGDALSIEFVKFSNNFLKYFFLSKFKVVLYIYTHTRREFFLKIAKIIINFIIKIYKLI